MIPAGERWVDHLRDLSPVERRTRFSWKRDDLFEPADGRGVNGAKVRSAVHLVDRAVARGATSLVFGGSVHSPAVARVAVVGEHYGLPVTIVLGGTNSTAAARHPEMRRAMDAGASFIYGRVAYNNAIRKRVRDLAAETPGAYEVPYAIGLPDDAHPDDLRDLYNLGADQVLNLPATLNTLVIPFGSGNAAAAILTGLAREGTDVARIVLVGLGPDRRVWLGRRLDLLAAVGLTDARPLLNIVEFVDLIGTGFTTYAKAVRYSIDGVTGHPHYEAKMLQWIDEYDPMWASDGPDHTTLWVVGS